MGERSSPQAAPARFGHPDPEVREAAELMEDEMWPFVTLAGNDREPDGTGRGWHPSNEERSRAYKAARAALVTFRVAVYNAPRKDISRNHTFTGEDPPSRVSRALEAEGKKISNDFEP